MATSTIRKNITMPSSAYEVINDYALQNNMTFSEFLRKAALSVIDKSENLELLNFLCANCAYVDPIEQAEIAEMELDFADLDGKEISLNELLQD